MLIRLAHGSFDVFSKAKHVASTRLAAGLYMSFLGFRMRTKSFIFIHLSSTVFAVLSLLPVHILLRILFQSPTGKPTLVS